MSQSESNPPVVTVIIAAYNASASLKLAIETVLGQDFTDFELWVIGDACTDDSERVVQAVQDPRVFWHNRTTNSGSMSVPYGEALQRARGKYIAYLGHDDPWFPWHLSSLVAAAESAAAEVVYGLAAIIDPTGPLRAQGPGPEDVDGQILQPVSSQLMHTRALTVEQVKWRDARTLSLAIDVDFWVQLCKATERRSRVARLTTFHFPSALWRTYTATAERPQPKYRAQMRADPEALEHEVLCALARRSARAPIIAVTFGQSLLLPAQMVYARIVHAYGRERWPLRPFLRWRQQRIIARNRRKRGLPPLPPL